ncbi:vWA domain-containing protein [Segnochrobactrum spirostomi]|uniref:VWA domain-containing protein n=1 Tax=Segnochrobactrum spirostomi TaxID=2608987 RepID=A0A6A7YAA3_9HYPH|nr:vWA domain-containing protein [Segnochrobactrum spirostomi]MQT14948.1 VWA domain-containing protein [Segnochrobactrum spirostomi]
MSTFVLLRPWWLVVLPLLALLALRQLRAGADLGGWERVMSPAMAAAMRNLGHLRGARDTRRFGALAAAALLGLGLAGPAVPRADAPLLAGSGAILIALDLSPSVARGTALADAQAAAASVLAASGGRPVGLVLFSGEAYDVAAPTADPASLESLIAVLGPETMPSGGSRPATALALAQRMLAGSRDADVVLISDGGGIDDAARAEAARLSGASIRLDALVLDRAAGGATDPAALRALAAVSAPARAPEPVLRALKHGGRLDRDPALTSLQYRDFGPVLAALAAVPLVALFRRRA